MATASRGETIFRRQREDEFGFPEIDTEGDMQSPRQVLDTPDPDISRPSASRASAMFQTGQTPAEQAFLGEIQKPEPTYTRPRLSTKRSVFGRALESLPGTRRIGEELLYGPESRAKEDFGLAIGARQRRLANMRGAAAIEARQQQAQNAALYRGADINYKGARNLREEALQPGRLKLQQSQVERNRQMGRAQEALATQRATAARSPFRPIGPGMGVMSQATGKITTPANPAAARAARAQAGTGGVTPVQLAGVERNKAAQLAKWKTEFDKQAAAIEKENLGIRPTLPDGSKNPMYTFDAKMADLNKKDLSQKQVIQRSYEEQLRRLGQNVTPYNYGDIEFDTEAEPAIGADEPDMSGDAMDQVDLQDQQDAANPESENDIPDLPVGTTYRNPDTGERIQWDGTKWVPAPRR